MSSLENLYISPLELCNLRCLYCYTPKTKSILTNQQILSFVASYKKLVPNLKSIIFCGGEVFTLPDFVSLVNNLLSQGIFISIITNGTVDHLDQISDPKNCQLIVSFDGPEDIHDKNRGQGNFAKSTSFVKKALNLGFPVEIFYLITKDSYSYRDSFPSSLYKLYELSNLSFTYLTDRLGSLSPSQVKDIRQNYPCYPPKDFGCNIFSLQSDGKFYGCCETSKSIGSLGDPLDKVIEKYLALNPVCNDPSYKCNL